MCQRLGWKRGVEFERVGGGSWYRGVLRLDKVLRGEHVDDADVVVCVRAGVRVGAVDAVD